MGWGALGEPWGGVRGGSHGVDCAGGTMGWGARGKPWGGVPCGSLFSSTLYSKGNTCLLPKDNRKRINAQRRKKTKSLSTAKRQLLSPFGLTARASLFLEGVALCLHGFPDKVPRASSRAVK